MKHPTRHTSNLQSDAEKIIQLTSPAFQAKEMIPAKYTCDGINVSPPLDIDNIPPEAKSLAIIVDDPDAPVRSWLHWVAWNIPILNHVEEGRVMEAEGLNDFGVHHYKGPCPPSGVHRYHFKVYALDCTLHLPLKTNRSDLEKAMRFHILGTGELMGLYKKSAGQQ